VVLLIVVLSPVGRGFDEMSRGRKNLLLGNGLWVEKFKIDLSKAEV
jgi:hypothetical protein